MNKRRETKEEKVLITKIGKEETQTKNRIVEGAVAAYVETKAEIDRLTNALKSSKNVLVEEAKNILGDDDVSTITFGVDEDKVQIGFGYDIKITDDDTLYKILGERFEDLVTVKTSLTPDKKLKEMALEDDGLAECMSVKEKAPTFKVVK